MVTCSYVNMYVEKRKVGRTVKYFLVHSYRENGKVRKIRRYLGQNLSEEGLKEAKEGAEPHILRLLEELDTEVFLFSLTKNQVNRLNRYDGRIRVAHFDKNEWQRFTEEFVFNTNAIEGSTVKREKVPEILRAPKARYAEEIETKGVAKAIAYVKRTNADLSVGLIKRLHRICFKGSKGFAGCLRNVEVVVSNSRGEILHEGVPAAHVPLALKDMVAWNKANKKKFRPLVLAAIIHNQFEYIHPFQDGNGRVGRLLLNFVLLKNGYPPINIALEDRGEYYRTLQEYQKNQNLKPTVEFLVRQYKKTLKKVTTNNKKQKRVAT